MIQNRMSASLLVKAAQPVIEMLEERQMLSATLSASSSLMVFNAVEDSSPSQVETLTLTDTGDAALTLGAGSITIANDPSSATQDAARFSLVNAASIPATLAPGASFGLEIDYSAIAVTDLFNSTILEIASNDPVNPTTSVTLHGIGTKGLGGINQPSLATILQAYDIPTYVGEGPDDADASEDSTYPYPPDPSSQEVVLQRLQKAGPGPVTIDVLASFTASGAHPYTLGTYTPGDPSSLNQLFTTPSSQSQSTYVQPQGATSFDPGSSDFGFYCVSNVQVTGRIIYTEDALNTFDTTTGRHFRFFPMEEPDGTVVPNEYIMTSTEWNAPVGYDFTNIVAIVSNIKAASGAPGAPVMGLQNLNAEPGSDTMVFNTIESPNTVVGNQVHNIGTLQVNNTGDEPLILESYTISPQWKLVNPPTFPATVAAGSDLDLSVEFIASSEPSVPYNETNGPTNPGGGGLYSGSLTLVSNDPVTPTVSVALEGWWQFHSENENEPSLQTLVNLLYGWGTDINSTPIPDLNESSATSGTSPTYYGEEVVSPYWEEADPGLRVTVQQLAGYHTEGNTATTYWYPKGSPGSTTKLFNTALTDGQTLFPYAANTSTPAAASFTTTDVFGFNCDGEYTDDSLNPNTPGGGHHFRFYPVRNSAGELVPNAYIMAMDYTNTPENFDFQDNVWLITNIRPATTVTGISSPQTTGAPPAPTDLYATNATAGNLLQWSPLYSDSTLEGYDVYRASSASGPYTLLTSSPIGATSYNDTSAPTTGTSYYEVTAVDSSTSAQSLAIAASVVNAGSSTTTGNPVAVNQTVNTMEGAAVIVNVLTDASDTGGTLLPSSVAITTQPADGTTSVNASNGTVTYTPNPGFTGVDSFQYTVGDSTGAVSAPATITVNVSSTPIGNPVAANLSESTPEDNPLTIDVVASATDTSATLLPATVTITAEPSHGTVSVDPTTGDILYTPAANYVGTDFLEYSIGDSLSAVSAPATINITVTANGPVAANLSAPPVVGTSPTTVNVAASATDSTGTINPASVTITSAPADGTATVNKATGAITYVANSGFVGIDTLKYTISDVSGTLSVPATLSFSVGLSLSSSSASAKSLAYVDAGGNKVRLALTGPGNATIYFNGAGQVQDLRNHTLSLTGTGLSISSMQITGSTMNSALVITRTGPSLAALNDVTVTGALGRISAPTAALGGGLSVSGSLGTLQLGDASSATIVIGSTGATRAGLSFTATDVTDTTLSSATSIHSLKVSDWIESDDTDSVSAPSIASLATSGNFEAALSASGGTPYALGTVHIGGQISADTWSIAGNTSSIFVGSVASGWTGNFTGSINSFTIRAAGFAGDLTADAINTLAITGNDNGSITAASIRSARVNGQLNGASVTVTNGPSPHATSLGRLTVTGATVNSQIISAGNVGPVSTAGMSGSSLDAGANSGATLPSASTDFTSAATISSFSITGRGSTFADSDIAASALGPLSLGEVITASGSNGGGGGETSSASTPFGIAAATIRSLSMLLDSGGGLQRLSSLVLLSDSSIAAYVAAHDLTLNDFVIRTGL